MGKLYYGALPEPTEIPDRLLAHLKVVITTKLRRGESFTVSWTNPASSAAGRTTLWLQPSIPMRFVFDSPEPEILNATALKEMAVQANSTSGLTVDLGTVIRDADDPNAVAAPTAPAPRAKVLAHA